MTVQESRIGAFAYVWGVTITSWNFSDAAAATIAMAIVGVALTLLGIIKDPEE